MGFWREELLVCLAAWLQSLLNYSSAGKNEAGHAPEQRSEIPEICMNKVTRGISSKERASLEEILALGSLGVAPTPGPI